MLILTMGNLADAVRASDELQHHLSACVNSCSTRTHCLLLPSLGPGIKLEPPETCLAEFEEKARRGKVQELSASVMLELVMKEVELEKSQNQ